MKTMYFMRVCIFIPIILISLLTQAQENKVIDLEEVEVSANRVTSKLSETFKSVEVITKEEIMNVPAQNIEELLEYVTQVDIRQRGTMGVQADLSIRGGTFEQTLILLNGVKISDPQTAHHNFNLPLNINSIERIEILKGPGARIYGQNAFSGAINIITKPGDERNAELHLAGGENKYLSGNLNLSVPVKSYHQKLSVGNRSSDGYKTNTDFNISNLFYQSSFKNKLNFITGYTDKEFGANGFYSNLFPWQWEHTKTTFANLGFKGKHIEPKIYYRNNKDEFLLKRDTPNFYRNYHTTDVLGIDVNSEFSSKYGKTSFGAEARSEWITSTSLGDHQRSHAGFYLEHRYIHKKLIVSPGALISWFSDYDPGIYPGIDIGYHLSNNTEIFGGIGRSYRIPTFTELYYNSPANIGNSELKPEVAVSYEVGFRKKKAFYKTSLTVFNRYATNLIDWTRTADTLAWKVQNVSKINTRGIEAGLTFYPKKLKGSIPVNRLGINYSYMNADQLPTEFLSKNVLDYLQNQLVLSFDYNILKRVKQSWKIKYEDRIGYESHTLVDSRINYAHDRFSAYIEASNIFNTTYFEFGGLEMPGRWTRIGIVYSLGF